nr:hypothetical protein GCM10025732_36250 [Glycomyces mayteni]
MRRNGFPASGASKAAVSPSTTTVLAARAANPSPLAVALTRSADANSRTPGRPKPASGRSRTTSAVERGASATSIPPTQAVPGFSVRFGTPVTVPPPLRTSCEGDELVVTETLCTPSAPVVRAFARAGRGCARTR